MTIASRLPQRSRDLAEFIAWATSLQSRPPALLKRRRIRLEAAEAALTTLVETGTYRGGTVAALRQQFAQIFSVELDDALWAEASRRFSDCDNVKIIHGDSADVLKNLVPTLLRPSLYWLDAHYSGGVTARGADYTPILQELQVIAEAGHADDVVLIDDARLFDKPPYPSVDDLEQLVRTLRPKWSVVLDAEADLIRLGYIQQRRPPIEAHLRTTSVGKMSFYRRISHFLDPMKVAPTPRGAIRMSRPS